MPVISNHGYLHLLIASLLLVNFNFHPSLASDIVSKTPLLDDVLFALEKVTTFLALDFSTVNLDGLFGTRVAEGAINQTLAGCRTQSLQCPKQLTRKLFDLLTVIDTIIGQAIPYVEQADQIYYKQFKQTVDSPYLIEYETENLVEAISKPGYKTKYDESAGDNCISAVFGTLTLKDGSRSPACDIDEKCWKMMTEPGTAGYAITHQLLYFILGEKAGCLNQLSQRLRAMGVSSVRQFEKHLCGHIYSEVWAETEGGIVNEAKQDLFLEQSLLCGILGFQDFISEEWVRMVLRWQTAKGCFSMSPTFIELEKEISAASARERRLMNLLVAEANAIDRSATHTGRKLLREQLMNGDCLAHKTGLAFGTLAVYLRHLVNQLYS